MKMLKYVLFISFMFVIFFQNSGISQPQKAFYIGHSLSDQIPDMVKSLSTNHPTVNFDWVYQSIPGAPLRWQWDRKDANDYGSNPPYYAGFYDEDLGLPTGDFDILVLTESVPRHMTEWGIGETYQYTDSFFVYANTFNSNTKVFLYEVWHCLQSGTPTGCDYDIDASPWRQRLTDDLPMWESAVDTLNARFDPVNPVCLIPAGQGLARLYDSIQTGVVPGVNSIEDLFSDDIHLTDIGKYFVACVHFATIHETTPVGLTNQLQVWWGGNFDAPSEELALKFQEIAWQTVIEYEHSCVELVLPVNLISFTAQKSINNSVLLKWTTSAEINNDFFTIEKSSDSKNWTSIQHIKSKSTSSDQVLKYDFLDSEPFTGTAYYRLKQTDFDGTTTTSKIVSITNSTGNIKIFPNPATQLLYIDGIVENSEVKILNSLGQMMQISNHNPINIESIPSGLYHIIIDGQNYNFIKQ